MKLKNGLYFLPVFFALAMVMQSCTKSNNASPIPMLEYKDYSKLKTNAGKDSLVIINMTFEDGDGDIGLSESDSFPPFRFGSPNFYNLLVEFYTIDNDKPRKITSQFLQDPITGDTVNFNQRISNITPEGRDKYINGRIKLLTPFQTVLDYSMPLPDSVYYTITLQDRSLNNSNTVQSPVIVLDLQ